MKVGDLVQQGSRVMEIRKSGKKQKPPKRVGTVVAIHELPDINVKDSRRESWRKVLGGRSVDVLWSNGKLSKNFAENSLEVISEGG